MTRRTVPFILIGALAAPVAGVAVATPSRPSTPPVGLTSQLLARGAAGEVRLRDDAMGLKLSARRATDVAVVQATLAAGGTTGWHRHPGPSLVLVKTGALTMVESDDGRHWHGATTIVGASARSCEPAARSCTPPTSTPSSTRRTA